jgi:hypothetical protein
MNQACAIGDHYGAHLAPAAAHAAGQWSGHSANCPYHIDWSLGGVPQRMHSDDYQRGYDAGYRAGLNASAQVRAQCTSTNWSATAQQGWRGNQQQQASCAS